MRDAGERWLLAFDGSCGSCRTISRTVAHACDGRLDVLPLAHPEVRRWRERGLSSGAPWAPTLLRLGPAAGATAMLPLSLAVPGCSCSVDSDWCTNSTVCESYERDCRQAAHGCGTFYSYACDGRCFNA